MQLGPTYSILMFKFNTKMIQSHLCNTHYIDQLIQETKNQFAYKLLWFKSQTSKFVAYIHWL